MVPASVGGSFSFTLSASRRAGLQGAAEVSALLVAVASPRTDTAVGVKNTTLHVQTCISVSESLMWGSDPDYQSSVMFRVERKTKTQFRMRLTLTFSYKAARVSRSTTESSTLNMAVEKKREKGVRF